MDKMKLEMVFEYLEENPNSVPIGSRVWGGSKEDSDYDFCMDHKVFLALKTKLEKMGVDVKSLYGISVNEEGTPAPDTIMQNIGNYKFDLYKKKQGLYDRTNGPEYEKIVVNIITYTPENLLKIEDINQAFTAIEGTEIHKRICKDKDIRVMVFECFKNVMFKTVIPDVDEDFEFPF